MAGLNDQVLGKLDPYRLHGPIEGDPANPNPRTLVGLSHHGRLLCLVVIDGRVKGYSTATTNAQSARH